MELIGAKVKHKKFGIGLVTKIDNGILIVKFSEREVNFQYPIAFETFLVAEDDNVQNYMLEQISAAKKTADEERLAKELKRKKMELAAQAREEEKSKSKSSTSKTVVSQRIEGKRMIYYVFQGNTFDKEFRGGYIWAPVANKAGLKPHHWTRLVDVRKDDIILHGCDGYIKAVSIAKDKCYECKQPDELKTEELWDMEGRRVDCDYTLIPKPVKTSIFVDDIIRLCRVKYSPFDKDGNGNMGYLYEMNRELAKIFIKALVENNNSLTNLGYINEVLAEEDMIEVVAALIWDNDKFMICQRPANKARELLWEFVGGKVEPGETKEQALIRECQEELAITLAVGDVFMDVVHEYPDITVHLTLFNATIAEGVPQRLEHNSINWITVAEIDNYDFCPADDEILKELKSGKKVITNFDPTNFEFTFNFTEDTCPKLKTGVCDLEEIDLILDKKISDKQLRSLSRCQRIYFGIRDKTFRVLPPQIVRCECGHYICIDGQHRICVAQNKNLKLDVHMFKETDGDCEKCMPIPEKEYTEMTINGIKFNVITG